MSDEAYLFSDDGTAIIPVIAAQGGLHAFHTLPQHFYTQTKSPPCIYTPYAPIRIRDRSVFKHRGLNLDIPRNEIPPREVMRTIRAMSYNKLDRLHLHASDSPSWHLDIPALPDLADKGAYHPNHFWKLQDLNDVQVWRVS